MEKLLLEKGIPDTAANRRWIESLIIAAYKRHMAAVGPTRERFWVDVIVPLRGGGDIRLQTRWINDYLITIIPKG